MPFHKLAIILIGVTAASGVTILAGVSLGDSLDLSGPVLPIIWLAALLCFAGWRYFLKNSDFDDRD